MQQQQWYYIADAQRMGPVYLDDLKQAVAAGRILPSDQVYRVGDSYWIQANTVEGLFRNTSDQAPASPLDRLAKFCKTPMGGASALAALAVVVGVGLFLPNLLTEDAPLSSNTSQGQMKDVASEDQASRQSKTPNEIEAVDLPKNANPPKISSSIPNDSNQAPRPSSQPSNSDTNPKADSLPNWISLFDGTSLKGWHYAKGHNTGGIFSLNPVGGEPAEHWRAKDGELVLLNYEAPPFLTTNKDYKNFEFRCDFMLSDGGNSGVLLRGKCELQLLDDKHPRYNTLRPNQLCGAIYGLVVPTEQPYLGANKWNSLYVRLEGNRVTVSINDTKVINAQSIPGPAMQGNSGPIALQNHGSAVRFRNMEIRPIK